MALPSATDVYEYLEGYGISSTIITSAWIEKRRDRNISKKIEQWTGFPVEGIKEEVEYVSGTGSSIIFLSRHSDTIVLKSIKLVQSSVIDWNLNLENIEVLGSEGVLKAKNSVEDLTLSNWVFPRGKKNLKITYDIGYGSNLPDDLNEAILLLMCEQTLMQLAGRTGGGSTPNKSFGNRGRYSEIRNDLARQAMSLIRPFMTAVVGT